VARAPGLDFVVEIERAVASCDVLLAVIGRHWLQSADAPGWQFLGSTAAGTGGRVVFVITSEGTLLQSTFLNTKVTGIGLVAPLIQASDGRLYGTAPSGGSLPSGQAASGTCSWWIRASVRQQRRERSRQSIDNTGATHATKGVMRTSTYDRLRRPSGRAGAGSRN
jgi:hypothetical protein